jgi:hypothetical protein
VTRHFGIKHRGIDPYMVRLMGKLADEASRLAETNPPSGGGSNNYKRTPTAAVTGEGDTKKKELWVVLNRRAAGDRAASKAAADLLAASGGVKSKAKGETWVVTNNTAASSNSKNADAGESSSGGEVDSDANDDEDDDNDDDNNSNNKKEAAAEEKKSDSSARRGGGGGRGRKRQPRGERSTCMEEFRRALRENLRTKDGAYCTAKDDSSVICVCGKVIRICNAFYWKYLVQKPRVVNGKLYARGHWYVCEEVKRRGSEYQLTPEEKAEIRRELELSQNKGNGINQCCGSGSESGSFVIKQK